MLYFTEHCPNDLIYNHNRQFPIFLVQLFYNPYDNSLLSLLLVLYSICSYTYSLDCTQHILQNIFPICLPLSPDWHGNQGLNYGYLQCGWIINQLTRGMQIKAVKCKYFNSAK